MKIEIKSRYTGQIIISGEWKTLRDCVMQNKSNLRDADLGGADLRGAYLGGADLRDAKEYKNSHDIFVEIIRRQDISVFTAIEWQAIGVINIHRICWLEIKEQFSGVMTGIFQKLADVGFDEWLLHWKTIEIEVTMALDEGPSYWDEPEFVTVPDE